MPFPVCMNGHLHSRSEDQIAPSANVTMNANRFLTPLGSRLKSSLSLFLCPLFCLTLFLVTHTHQGGFPCHQLS